MDLGVVVQADLDEAVQRSASGAFPFGSHGLGEGAGELQPVHGVHSVGVLHHRLGLVALQLADEVPAKAEVGQCGGLVGGFLVPVFADVGDAEGSEPPDVVGGVEFGDDDQPGRGILPAGGGHGVVNAEPDGREAFPELRQARIVLFSHR